MKLAYLALAAGIATAPLFATPAQADPVRPHRHTYECEHAIELRNFPPTVIAHECFAFPGSPRDGHVRDVTLIIRHHFGEHERRLFRCEFANLERFPETIVAHRCFHEHVF